MIKPHSFGGAISTPAAFSAMVAGEKRLTTSQCVCVPCPYESGPAIVTGSATLGHRQSTAGDGVGRSEEWRENLRLFTWGGKELTHLLGPPVTRRRATHSGSEASLATGAAAIV